MGVNTLASGGSKHGSGVARERSSWARNPLGRLTSSNHQITTDRKSAYTSARNQRVTTYRSVILIHEVVIFKVEEPLGRVGWGVCKLGHWLGLSVERHQSTPGNAIVKEMAMGDDVLRRMSRDKEGEL